MRFFPTVAVLLFPLVVHSQAEPRPAAAPEACPPASAQDIEAQRKVFGQDRRRVTRVSANVGIDALGRMLLAVDLDRDGMVDELVLFTPSERLPGPWSQFVPSADYETTRGTLRIEAADRSLAIALAVEPAALPAFRHKPAAQARIVTHARGLELARQRPGAETQQRLESYDHTLIDSWPESFRRDLVAPDTAIVTCLNCSYTPCQTGGCYAHTCGRECAGIIAAHECTIGCNVTYAFACCNCTNGIVLPVADCRCIRCSRPRGPIY